MRAIITPTAVKSRLVDGFDTIVRVARIALAEPDHYRELVADDEWRLAQALDGHRRVELLAGRAAARAALHALIGPTEAVIARADDGAPEIRGIDDPPRVSISHGRDAAVAAVARVACLGIDLCDRDDAPRVRRVATRFVRAEETALAERAGVDGWVALWALKEAGAKALRRGLLDGGLRATQLASIAPPEFLWPAFTASLVAGEHDTVALVFRG